MKELPPPITPAGLYKDLVGVAYAEFVGTPFSNDHVEFEGSVGSVTQIVQGNDIALIQGQKVSGGMLGSVIRLLQDVLEHPAVNIAYEIRIEDPPPDDGRAGKYATLSVDVQKAAVEKLKKAGAVLAGYAGAKTILKNLGDIADPEDAALALQTAREAMHLQVGGPEERRPRYVNDPRKLLDRGKNTLKR